MNNFKIGYDIGAKIGDKVRPEIEKTLEDAGLSKEKAKAATAKVMLMTIMSFTELLEALVAASGEEKTEFVDKNGKTV